MLNVALLLDELRFLTINPDKWDQGIWAKRLADGDEKPRVSACGSFGCLAGNTVIHQNIELDWYRSYHYDANTGQDVPSLWWQADNTVEGDMIDEKAQELLGLTEHQAERLFEGDNTLDDLWDLAERMTLGEIDDYDYAQARWDKAAKAERDHLDRLMEEENTHA